MCIKSWQRKFFYTLPQGSNGPSRSQISSLQEGRVIALERSHMNSCELLATLRQNNRTNYRNNAPSPQNNSNCYTRGPVELQAYENCYCCYRTGEVFQGFEYRECEPAERGGGGTLDIFRWGCAARTLKPLPNTRPCSADFATLSQTCFF